MKIDAESFCQLCFFAMSTRVRGVHSSRRLAISRPLIYYDTAMYYAVDYNGNTKIDGVPELGIISVQNIQHQLFYCRKKSIAFIVGGYCYAPMKSGGVLG